MTTYLGQYKKGLGRGGRARMEMAKAGLGYVRTKTGYRSTGGRKYLPQSAVQYDLSSELKFFDTATNFQVDATGEVPATGQLCLIPQGVTDSTRIGRKCVIKSIECKWILTYAPGGSGTATTTITILIVLDQQANSAAAGVTDVLTGNVIPTAMINLSNSQRFRILKRINVNLTSAAGVTTAYNAASRLYKYYRRCNIPLEFSAGTGAITEIKSNNIFLLAGTDQNSDDLVSVLGNVRLRFSD